MSISNNIYMDFLQDQIGIQTKNMRLLVLWFLVLLVAGMIASILLFAYGKKLDDVFKIGPSIIMTAISSFPLKTILVNRERVSGIKSLKSRLERAKNLPASQRKVIEKIVEDTIKEIMKR